MNPQHNSQADEGWRFCEGQELQVLSDRLHTARNDSQRRQQFRAASLLSAALALCLATGLSYAIWGVEQAHHKDCQFVLNNAKAYIHHQLDHNVTAFITEHLGFCQQCKEKIIALNKEEGLPPLELSSAYELYDPAEFNKGHGPIIVASLNTESLSR